MSSEESGHECDCTLTFGVVGIVREKQPYRHHYGLPSLQGDLARCDDVPRCRGTQRELDRRRERVRDAQTRRVRLVQAHIPKREGARLYDQHLLLVL